MMEIAAGSTARSCLRKRRPEKASASIIAVVTLRARHVSIARARRRAPKLSTTSATYPQSESPAARKDIRARLLRYRERRAARRSERRRRSLEKLHACQYPYLLSHEWRDGYP